MQEQMRRAKDLIQSGNYEQARRLLATVDHLKAREWERKIDDLETPEPDFGLLPMPVPAVSVSNRHHPLPTTKYRALRLAATLYQFGGVTVVVLGSLLGLSLAMRLNAGEGLTVFFGAWLGGISMLAFGQMIYWMIDVEGHLQMMTLALQRILDQQD